MRPDSRAPELVALTFLFLDSLYRSVVIESIRDACLTGASLPSSVNNFVPSAGPNPSGFARSASVSKP